MGDRRETDDEARNMEEKVASDVETIREILRAHPVELAVLFGSTVTGSADSRSDIDIAVKLSDDVADPRRAVVMDILVDLSVALDRNDVDLSLVDDLRPRVGRAAFEHGELLLGSEDRAAEHRESFDERVDEPSQEVLRKRLDEALDSVDRHLGAGAR